MASEQTNTNKAISQAVADAAIQAMAVAGAERAQNVAPRLGGPMMKQFHFNQEANDKYNKLKNFRLEVNHIFKSYNTPK